jgi:hypothetical protein
MVSLLGDLIWCLCWAALGQNAIPFTFENELLFETESSCGSLQKVNGEIV